MIVNLEDFSPVEFLDDIPWDHFDHRPRTGAEAMDEKLGELIEDDSVLGPVLMAQQLKRLSVNVIPSRHTVSLEADPLLQPVGPSSNVNDGQ